MRHPATETLTGYLVGNLHAVCGLTKKAEPPPTRDVNRDSGTDSANGGWLRRLVRRHGLMCGVNLTPISPTANPTAWSFVA